MRFIRALVKPRSAQVGLGTISFAMSLILSTATMSVAAQVIPVVPPGALNQGSLLGTPLQILWTNDTHGYFLPVYHAEYSEMDTYAQTAATEGKVGGYAQIAGLVKVLRQGIWEKNTLFMDAGDTFDGSPVAQMTRGQAVVPILNAMGYDAWTPGNRDFAWPSADFYAVTSKLNFPMVCSNLIDTSTQTNPFPSYLIKQIGGLKVALLGLTSLAGGGQGFNTIGGAVPGAMLENSISTLAANVRATENPDLVVVISHMGYYIDQKLAARTTGIDVIVGAHTHHNVYTPPVIANADNSRKVVIVQAGSHGKFIGRLQLWVKDKKVVDYGSDLIRVSAESMAENHAQPDATVEALAQAAYAPFKAMLEEEIGRTETMMFRRGDTQSTMVNFLTDAMADLYNVDIARFPGIRYGATILPGPITVGDVWNIVSPNFGNDSMFVFTQTGGQILGVLNAGLNNEYGTDPYQWNGGDVFRFNGAVKYSYNVDAVAGKHLVDVTVTKTNDQSITLMSNGVPQNLATPFSNAATFPAAGAASQRVMNDQGKPVSAVDEIVNYIKNKSSAIAPVIDDRTVQLDSAVTNISDVTTNKVAPVLNAPGLLIAPGQNDTASSVVPVATDYNAVNF